jgi:hypothetical protein
VEGGTQELATCQRLQRGRPLAIWIETAVNDGEDSMFPYRVHVLNRAGRVSGIWIELQTRQGVDDLIAVLRTAITLEVVHLTRRERRAPCHEGPLLTPLSWFVHADVSGRHPNDTMLFHPPRSISSFIVQKRHLPIHRRVNPRGDRDP